MTTFTFPDVQWCAPVSVTGDAPVLNIFQPVAKTAFTDGLWNPVDCIVVADKVFFNVCHFDKPGISCIVEKWCITTPAVWIAVFVFWCCKQFAAFAQVFDDFWICVFYKHTIPGCTACHFAFLVNKLYQWQTVTAAYLCVVFTECRCDMNNTCTVCQCNVVSTSYVETFFFRVYKVPQWFVFFEFQVFTCVGFQNFVFAFA